MASTSEVGHAKNVANLQKLIEQRHSLIFLRCGLLFFRAQVIFSHP